MKSWLIEHQQLLSQQFSRNILPHAILVSGVTGAGKLELAQWLVHLLSCQQPQSINNTVTKHLQSCGHCKSCLLLKSKTYPDHLNLVAEKNSLGVDSIRHASAFLQKTAHLGKFKTILIAHAQTMTLAAANALLKTLEEPSDDSVIILLTNDIEMLLPTIVSRCRVLNIRPNVGQTLLTDISAQKFSGEAHTVMNNGFVNLTQLPELTDKTINKAFQDFKTCYINYLHGQPVESQLLQQLLNNDHALRWLEQITVNLQREQFVTLEKASSQSILSAELLNKLYKVIINGCKVIKSYTQANKQFVCQQLIMTISDVIEASQINKQEC
ncbi:MAG: DNA polymerase III subunit delta' [Colwellia sp.]|nr:DNA polymerase III subunit delta' [Colwellia sp.]